MAARLALRRVLYRRASTLSSTSAPPAASVSLPSLSNIEASWKGLSSGEQEAVFKHLEALQKKDWKELTLDQKKAAYYVAFGPHGPREPHLPPGSGIKIATGVVVAIAVAVGVFLTIRTQGGPEPKTLSKEWKDATKERLIEQKANPFTGTYAKHEEAQQHK